MMGLS
jgi:hypothetical protein